MTGDYSDLAPLERSHEVGGFRCASEAQTDYRSKVADFSNVNGNEQHLLLLAKDIGKNLAA